MKNILIDCLRYKYNTSNSHITFDVHKILDYVHDNWYRSISNKTVAEKFGFNPNYISNVVKKYTGLSLHKYILHMRIVKSLSYLETHKYSISEISKFCGFSDIYYFSKYFKKEMGISPSEYRKNL